MTDRLSYHLVVTIVPRGSAEMVVEASKRAGAHGATVLSGRGSGIHEKARFLGIPIEPEKDIVLTLIEKDKSEDVLDAITEAAGLDRPSTGVAFILDISRVAGIHHSHSV